MDLSLIVYTLSKFLIAGVFCYRPQTFAEAFCHPDTDNESDLRAIKENGFYLDRNNPICCTGNITSWRVCYHGPNKSNNMKLYTVKYAVYRLINGTQNYTQVSNHTFETTLRGERSNSLQYAEIIEDDFNCCDELLDTPFAVKQGDIIGACVVNPTGPGNSMLRRLDVVSEQPGVQLYMHYGPSTNQNTDYERKCERVTTLPATIEFDPDWFRPEPRRLHLKTIISKC